MSSLDLRGREIVIASHNRGKIAEFTRLLAPLDAVLVSAADLGLPEPVEDGTSFAANAALKARAIATATGKIALADDSGLAVTALDGAPGIHSGRWAETGTPPVRDFAYAMRRVHEALAGKPDCSAQFVTVLALLLPDMAEPVFFTGKVEGQLVWPPRGDGGFGYDPLFMPAGENRTFGEMSAADKARFSHRAAACAQLIAATRGSTA